MRLRKTLCLLAAIAVLAIFGLAQTHAADTDAKTEIKSLIEASYINGAFNALDPEAMVKGFHQDFAIFSPKGEELSKYPIDAWASSTRKRKLDPSFDAKDNQWSHTFASIDVTGEAASVKVELSKDGDLVFTDYLSLLRFDSGWRIVAKVYHRHPG